MQKAVYVPFQIPLMNPYVHGLENKMTVGSHADVRVLGWTAQIQSKMIPNRRPMQQSTPPYIVSSVGNEGKTRSYHQSLTTISGASLLSFGLRSQDKHGKSGIGDKCVTATTGVRRCFEEAEPFPLFRALHNTTSST